VIWSPLEATAIRFTGKIEPAGPRVRIALSIGRDQITLTAQDGRRSGVIDVVFVQQSVAATSLKRSSRRCRSTSIRHNTTDSARAFA
jgi:hypothetical protein